MPTRIIVTGCRNWNIGALATRIVFNIRSKQGDDIVIVHGDCPTGVDAAIQSACKAEGIETERHPAEWDNLTQPGARIHKRRDGSEFNANAGPYRNQEMVDAGAKFAIAIHRDIMRSRGTRDCVDRCYLAAISVWLISDERGEPRLLPWQNMRKTNFIYKKVPHE